MPADTSQRVLSPTELSIELGLSRQTLWRMRKNQTGPEFVFLGAQKIGYRRCAVDKWLDANSVPAAP